MIFNQYLQFEPLRTINRREAASGLAIVRSKKVKLG